MNNLENIKKKINLYEVGSSNKITIGLPTKAIATDNFLLLPPDKVKHILFLCSFKSSKSIKERLVFEINSFLMPLNLKYINIVSKTVIWSINGSN